MSAALRPARRPFGFTVLELIVAVVVIGLLAALAVPSFSAVTDRSRDAAAEATLRAVGREAAALAALRSDGVLTLADFTDTGADLAAETLAAGKKWTVVADDDPGRTGGPHEIAVAVADDGRTAGLALAADHRGDGWAAHAVVNHAGRACTTIREAGASGTAALALGCDGNGATPDGGDTTSGSGSSTVSHTIGDGIECEYEHGGQLYCYGRNYGLRIDDSQPDGAWIDTPTAIGWAPATAEVHPGARHLAVVDPDGHVWVAGDHDGDDTTGYHPPTRISDGGGSYLVADKVATGGSTTVIESTSGGLYVVGFDPTTGTTAGTAAGESAGLPALPGGREVAALECASNFICILATDGTVWCLGYNEHGQLGAGLTTAGPYADWQQVVTDDGTSTAPLTDVAEISLGERHAVARTTTGDVWAWGRATAGATGDDNSVTDRNVAVAVWPPETTTAGSQLTGTTELAAAGPDHSCAQAADGRWACWGTFDHDGDGTDTVQAVPVWMDAPVAAYDSPTEAGTSSSSGGSTVSDTTATGEVRDDFNDPDGTLVGRVTPVGALPWEGLTAGSDAAGSISAERLHPSGWSVVHGTGISDGVFSFVYQGWQDRHELRPDAVFRVAADGSRWQLEVTDYYDTWRLFRIAADGTVLWSYSGGDIPDPVGSRFDVELAGEDVTIKMDGTVLGRFSSPFNVDADGYGFHNGDTYIRFDDFSVSSQPTGVTAAPQDSAVAVAWNAAADAASYRVYVDGATTAAVEVAAPATTATVSGLTNDVTYSFEVTRVDSAGIESPRSTAVTATPNVHGALVFDGFDRPDGLLGGSATPIGGKAWSTSGTTEPQIVGGQLQIDSGWSYATLDTGVSELTASATFTPATSTSYYTGLLFRYTASSDHWRASVFPNRVDLIRYVGGTATRVAQISRTMAAGDVVTVAARGDQLELTVDGVDGTTTTRTVTDGAHQLETRAGLVGNGGTADFSKVDDFTVRP